MVRGFSFALAVAVVCAWLISTVAVTGAASTKKSSTSPTKHASPQKVATATATATATASAPTHVQAGTAQKAAATNTKARAFPKPENVKLLTAFEKRRRKRETKRVNRVNKTAARHKAAERNNSYLAQLRRTNRRTLAERKAETASRITAQAKKLAVMKDPKVLSRGRAQRKAFVHFAMAQWEKRKSTGGGTQDTATKQQTTLNVDAPSHLVRFHTKADFERYLYAVPRHYWIYLSIGDAGEKVSECAQCKPILKDYVSLSDEFPPSFPESGHTAALSLETAQQEAQDSLFFVYADAADVMEELRKLRIPSLPQYVLIPPDFGTTLTPVGSVLTGIPDNMRAGVHKGFDRAKHEEFVLKGAGIDLTKLRTAADQRAKGDARLSTLVLTEMIWSAHDRAVAYLDSVLPAAWGGMRFGQTALLVIACAVVTAAMHYERVLRLAHKGTVLWTILCVCGYLFSVSGMMFNRLQGGRDDDSTFGRILPGKLKGWKAYKELFVLKELVDSGFRTQKFSETVVLCLILLLGSLAAVASVFLVFPFPLATATAMTTVPKKTKKRESSEEEEAVLLPSPTETSAAIAGADSSVPAAAFASDSSNSSASASLSSSSSSPVAVASLAMAPFHLVWLALIRVLLPLFLVTFIGYCWYLIVAIYQRKFSPSYNYGMVWNDPTVAHLKAVWTAFKQTLPTVVHAYWSRATDVMT